MDDVRHALKMYFELLGLQIWIVVSRPWPFMVSVVAVALINFGMPLAWVGIFSAFGGTISGWDARDYWGAFGIAMFVFGVVNLFGNGMRDLPRLVRNGGLDRMLLRPLPWWSQLAANRFDATTPIDVVLGAVVLGAYIATEPPSLAGVMLFLASLVVAMVTLWCFGLVLPNALSFYIRNSQRVSLYSSYFIQDSTSSPAGLLTGPWRAFFLIGIPGLLVAPVPLKALSDIAWKEVVLGLVVAAFWLPVSHGWLNGGLKRHASGNLINR